MAKAGWASCDITPPLGLPMGGRGVRIAEGTEVLDPLRAFATILEDDAGHRLVLISVDLVNPDTAGNDNLCQEIAAATGTNPDAVLINASHTHSGPFLSMHRYATRQEKSAELLAYEASLRYKLLRLSLEAAARLENVEVRWREGQSEIGINRRLLTAEGIMMRPNPDGVYHRQLWVLEILSLEDPQRRAILFSHGCHPVIVYGHAWTTISAEWPGVCRGALQEKLGPETHAQFFQGLAGNVRPRVLADFENKVFRTSQPEDVYITGHQIAQDVLAALAEPVEALSLQLAAQRGWFMVRHGAAQPREYWDEQAKSDQEHLREAALYWQRRLDRDGLPSFPVQSWLIGLVQFAPDYALVYTNGEPFAEWYEVFRRALPQKHLVACGYTQDTGWYLPTDERLAEGGYELMTVIQTGPRSTGPLQPGIDAAATRSLHAMNAAIETMATQS